MTRKQMISFTYGNLAMMRDWGGNRKMIEDMVNAMPDTEFDPEDPVGDVRIAMTVLAQLRGWSPPTPSEIELNRGYKAGDLWAEFQES